MHMWQGRAENEYDPKMHLWQDRGWGTSQADSWDPWAQAVATRHLGRRESGQQSEGTSGERATEKIPVPVFSGIAGEEGEVGSTARSFLRRVEAWERVTRLPSNQRGVALYTALKDKAWVEAEALNIEHLSREDGAVYFKNFIKQRYMDIEVTQVGRIMSQFFRVLKRGNEESVRAFTGEFDRMVARLSEVQVTLPETVLAWMYVDKLRLDEAGEISLLASVQNEYSLKKLQEAALIHDRSLRKPYEESRLTRRDFGKPKPWRSEARAPRGVHMAEPASEGESSGDAPEGQGAEGEEDCVVSEEVAALYHETFLAHQNAKSRYQQALRGRGFDEKAQQERAAERLKKAKERSYCSACKKKGHWHRDPECPLRGQAKSVHFLQSGEVRHVNVCTVMLNEKATHDKDDYVAITDTACASTVVGHPLLMEYLNFAEEKGLPYRFEDDLETFKFGASRTYPAEFAAWLVVGIGGAWVALRTSVVACDVPFLIGKPALKALGAKIDLENGTIDFKKLNLWAMPCRETAGGHPAVSVIPEGSAPTVDWESLAFDKQSREQGGVHILKPAALAAYMAEAGGGTWGKAKARKPNLEEPAQKHKLFYEKKLHPETQQALCSPDLSVDVFLAWWRSTNLTKDFWLETPNEMIRIHIVARKFAFNPENWNTASEHLKQRLLATLGDSRVTERVPCHGLQVVQVDVSEHMEGQQQQQ